MVEEVGAVVIGAGVVGLAIARAFAARNIETFVLEGERQFGSWTSSRNSEVIHAGIYYQRNSLKARLCVDGRHRLYRYCEERAIPHRRTGKLIFAATADQTGELDLIEEAARQAGVEDLKRLTRSQAMMLEPELDCYEALSSPSSGIVDSHSFMVEMIGDLSAGGAQLVCNSQVARISRKGSQWLVHLDGSRDADVATPILVNAAGLAAQAVARSIEALAPERIPALHLARGVYFRYMGRVPFRHLIYPVPVPGGLGTHLTLDMADGAKFGPDVEWIDTIDYGVDPGRSPSFLAAARRIWPGIDPDRLVPGYAGIRPKLSGPGDPPADFVISGPHQHGLPGLVNLFGIESPGLTASLAIAEEVVGCLN